MSPLELVSTDIITSLNWAFKSGKIAKVFKQELEEVLCECNLKENLVKISSKRGAEAFWIESVKRS